MSTQTADLNIVGLRLKMALTDVDVAQREAAMMSQIGGKVALRNAMRALLRVMRRGLVQRLPRRSGKLRRSVRTKVKVNAANSTVTGRLSYGAGGAFYAHMLERGTGQYGPLNRPPYTIRPRRKKALWILGAGIKHPVASVKIKGIKPRRYLEHTAQQNMNAARQAFNDAFRESYRGVTKVFKT